MNHPLTMTPCPCGHRGCQSMIVAGARFDRETAERIVNGVNRWEALMRGGGDSDALTADADHIIARERETALREAREKVARDLECVEGDEADHQANYAEAVAVRNGERDNLYWRIKQVKASFPE